MKQIVVFMLLVLALVITGCSVQKEESSSQPEDEVSASSEHMQSEPDDGEAAAEPNSGYEILILEPTEPDLDEEIEQLILASVQTMLEEYRTGTVDTTVPVDSEANYMEMPDDFQIPEITSYEQLDVVENEYMGTLYAKIKSVDGRWEMAVSINSSTFHMADGTVIAPDYSAIGASFMEVS